MVLSLCRPRAGTAKRSLLPALEVPTRYITSMLMVACLPKSGSDCPLRPVCSSVLDDLAVVHLQGELCNDAIMHRQATVSRAGLALQGATFCAYQLPYQLRLRRCVV